MKIVWGPFHKATTDKLPVILGYSIPILFLLCLMGIIVAISTSNWMLGMPSGILASLLILLHQLISRGKLSIVSRENVALLDHFDAKIIGEITQTGFTYGSIQAQNSITWIDVREVDIRTKIFSEDKTLHFTLTNGKQISLDTSYLNWHLLLKRIPEWISTSQELESFRTEIFSHLSSCKICGKVAVYHQKCLSCHNSVYEKIPTGTYANEAAYIKDEQLFLFAPDAKGEPIDFYADDEDGFERDESWRPLVTQEEVWEDMGE